MLVLRANNLSYHKCHEIHHKNTNTSIRSIRLYFFFFFGFTLLIAFRMIILQYIFLNQHFLYYFLSCLNSNTDLLYNNVHLLNMTELYP